MGRGRLAEHFAPPAHESTERCHLQDEPAQFSAHALLGVLQCTVPRPSHGQPSCCLKWALMVACVLCGAAHDGHLNLCSMSCSITAGGTCKDPACCLLLQVPLQPQDIDWGDGAASLSNSSETRSLVEQQGALSASSASRHGGEAAGAAAAGMGGGQGDARFAAGGIMGSMGPSQTAGGLQGLHLTHDRIPAEMCMSGSVGLHAAAQLGSSSTVLWGLVGEAGWPAQCQATGWK